MALTLEELSAANIVAANSLSLRSGQERALAPISHSAGASANNSATAWQRVVTDGTEVVGFISGNFDPEADQEELRSCLWRISVEEEAQGRGVGTFAVHALANEARSRGFDHITALWEPGDMGPETFFLHMGFRPVGESQYGETIGMLTLE